MSFAEASGLPLWLIVIILALAVLSAGYLLSLLLELVDRILRPDSYSAAGKRIRFRTQVVGDDFVVIAYGRKFVFPIKFLVSRSNLSLENDREKIEVICYRIIEGYLLFKKRCRGFIADNVWKDKLYKLIDIQDSNHPNSTIKSTSGGEHHSLLHGHGYKITVAVRSILKNRKGARGIVAHELLHEYVVGATIGLRYLGEAVTEYIARVCVNLPHQGRGAYQGMIDIMTVLVEEKLRHGKDTLIVLAMQPGGLRSEIDQRLEVGIDEDDLRELFEFVPASKFYTIEQLVHCSLVGNIAETLNMLLEEIHNLEYVSRNHYQLASLVTISQDFVRALQYKTGADNLTRVQARGKRLQTTGSLPVVKPPRKPAKKRSKKSDGSKFLFFVLSVLTFCVDASAYLWDSFWELPAKGRRITASILLVVLLFSGAGLWMGYRWYFGADKVVVAPFDSHPLVMNRSHLTPEQFEQRKIDMRKNLGEAALFSRQKVEGVPQRLKLYWPTIKAAATNRNVDPLDIAPLAFQESFFIPTAYNADSKASGMYQFMEGTAKLSGLKVVDGDFRLLKDGKDFRQDAEKSSYATAELYRQALDRWGGEKLMAYWDHHAGTKYPTQVMTLYLDETNPGWKQAFGSMVKAMKSLNIGYWDLRLRPTPTFAPQTWKLMMELNTAKHDFSPDYPMRVETAKALVKELVDGNVTHFNEAFSGYKRAMEKFHLKGEGIGEEEVGAAWWALYADIDRSEFIPDCLVMAKVVKSGKWVKIPDDAKDTGFIVDKNMGHVSDKFLINGETGHNGDHMKNHQYALPETIGAALWLTAWYREVYRQEGKTYNKPIIITSLGRNLWFQGLLPAMGFGAATDQLPLHTAGLAFDAAMGEGSMDEESTMRWKFVLNEARSMGMISVSYEGPSNNTHIVPTPAFRQFFADYYHTRVKS